MARKSNALVAMQAATVKSVNDTPELSSRMQAVVREIEGFFGEAHAASLTSFWNIGRLIRQVAEDLKREFPHLKIALHSALLDAPRARARSSPEKYAPTRVWE